MSQPTLKGISEKRLQNLYDTVKKDMIHGTVILRHKNTPYCIYVIRYTCMNIVEFYITTLKHALTLDPGQSPLKWSECRNIHIMSV